MCGFQFGQELLAQDAINIEYPLTNKQNDQGQLAIIHHSVYYSANIIRIGGIHWILKLAHYT